MRRTTTRLSDGRELIYYDADPPTGDAPPARRVPRPDPRPAPPPVATTTALRTDRLAGETVAYAAHRQDRTHLPPAEHCPLCPATGGRSEEIPDPDYQVAVFENRFPSFGGGHGRCELVCFTADHDRSFADLEPARVALVLDAWTDRTAALSRLPGVRQVYCFENRGVEIGVTLHHPHGQIYAYPYLPPRTARTLAALARHRAEAGENLPDALLAEELADGRRIVAATDHWVAHVPYAARWPYEVQLRPRRRVPDLTALDEGERAEFPELYLRLLRGFDRLFGDNAPPTPYIAAWHQAPVGDPAPGEPEVAREEFALRLEVLTVRRGPGKLKHLAGSESGAGAFVSDVLPEAAAERLREVVSR
ncbi:galactose-1-phosphate uridylyltransferase [Streptomyces bohaiensis]|uniref:Galactose-1-phosphate uridylyltransferase n=1 Tax=Streptomyces bohaiensis TaxID=1431344 RepID=A0ABX1CEG5_9ACTN|nr:galactose-1-phosphate uridylyltransferase [Streptomyces bohaiensis]NJQ17451.1 galactose-1-phosphate uridylyltransferase [Streptomyces bohaiensis]